MSDGIFCKHYHGVAVICDAGIDPKTLREEHLRYPCYDQSLKTCASAVYPTLEEQESYEKEVLGMLADVTTARAKIIEQTKGKRHLSGKIECTKCKTGELHYSIAGNGHIHAQCTTPHCLNWVE